VAEKARSRRGGEERRGAEEVRRRSGGVARIGIGGLGRLGFVGGEWGSSGTRSYAAAGGLRWTGPLRWPGLLPVGLLASGG
jgi:hypothetical protein